MLDTRIHSSQSVSKYVLHDKKNQFSVFSQESCNKNIKQIVVYISFYHLRLIGIILRQLNIIVSHNTENCSCPIMQHSHILHTYSEGKV